MLLSQQTRFLVYCEQKGDDLCVNSLYSRLWKGRAYPSYVIVHTRFVQGLTRIAAG